jgi:hypothetical protein
MMRLTLDFVAVLRRLITRPHIHKYNNHTKHQVVTTEYTHISQALTADSGSIYEVWLNEEHSITPYCRCGAIGVPITYSASRRQG